jgi:hypothetical protein
MLLSVLIPSLRILRCTVSPVRGFFGVLESRVARPGQVLPSGSQVAN